MGFYSAFIVADKVTLKTRKAGEKGGVIWESTGESDFSIEDTKCEKKGTEVTLHLKKGDEILVETKRDIELEGFEEPLSFEPDSEFKRDLLSRCNWEEVVQQMFVEEPERQLSLFEEVDDE